MAADIRQQINQLPFTHFVLVGLLLGAGYFFLMFVGAEKYDKQIKSLQQQKQKLNKDIGRNQKVVDDLEKFQEEVSEIAGQFQSAVEYLPSKSRVEDVLDQLYKLARTTGVSMSEVTPSGTRREKFYEELRVSIKVTGSYGGITSFLVEVSKLSRIIKIEGISLKASSKKNLSGDGKLLDLSGVLVTYRYIETEGA